MTCRDLQCASGVALAIAVAAPVAVASPTGLNNIPTTDTPGHLQLVFQTYYTTDADRAHDVWLAFKGGLHFDLATDAALRFEYGLDSRVGEGEAGPTVAQFKFAGDLGEGLPSLAFGTANIAFSESEREDAGQAFPYGAISQDLGVFRLHAGYGFASDNRAAFFGLDRAFDLGQTRLTPRFDITQIDDQDQWLASAGFIWELTKHIAVEWWVSQPFDDGDTTYTIKINFGFRF